MYAESKLLSRRNDIASRYELHLCLENFVRHSFPAIVCCGSIGSVFCFIFVRRIEVRGYGLFLENNYIEVMWTKVPQNPMDETRSRVGFKLIASCGPLELSLLNKNLHNADFR